MLIFSLPVLPPFGPKAGTVMGSTQQSRVNKSPAFWPEEVVGGSARGKRKVLGRLQRRKPLRKGLFKLFMNFWAHPWVVQAWI